MEKMTKAEREAFEKYMKANFGEDFSEFLFDCVQNAASDAFLAGYRAGFSAQHYDVEVRPVDVDELVSALETALFLHEYPEDRQGPAWCADARTALAKHRGK